MIASLFSASNHDHGKSIFLYFKNFGASQCLFCTIACSSFTSQSYFATVYHTTVERSFAKLLFLFPSPIHLSYQLGPHCISKRKGKVTALMYNVTADPSFKCMVTFRTPTHTRTLNCHCVSSLGLVLIKHSY